MRNRVLGLLLLFPLLATAPGCRVIAGAAAVVGEVVIDGLLDDCDSDDGGASHHAHRAGHEHPERRAGRSATR